MQYELQHPKDVNQAADIIHAAFLVLTQQLEFEQGKRKRAWNGDFVEHVKKEAQLAIEWLHSRVH